MTNGRGRRQLSDSDYLWVVGIVALVIVWPLISAKLEKIAGSEIAAQVELMVPILLATLIVLAVLLLVRGIIRSARRKKRDMISAVLQELLPKSWEPSRGLMTAWRFLRVQPRRVIVRYPPESPDRDPDWRHKVTELVTYRAGMEASAPTWDTDRLRVIITATVPIEELPPTSEEKNRSSVLARVHLVIAPLFGASDVRIRIVEWTSAPDDPPGGYPLRIEVDYDPTTRDASLDWRRRLEAVVAVKVPPGNARWVANYETSADRITLRHRPPLPENLRCRRT